MADLKNFTDDELIILFGDCAIDALINQLSIASGESPKDIKISLACYITQYVRKMSEVEARSRIFKARTGYLQGKADGLQKKARDNN